MKRIVTAFAVITLGGCAVSQQQEVQMGQQYAAQIAQQLPLMSDPEVVRYINVLGDSIAKLTPRADLDWHFYVVNAPEVNAFAVPGGYVYVNRGLIERATQMDELAGVLGHEIGHVVKRHSIDQMQKAQGANIGVTLACVLTGVCDAPGAADVINVAGGAVFAKFSRKDETEADEQGVLNVVHARISPQGMVTMFQKLLEERRTRPSAVEQWFATHPLEEDRIAHVQAIINKYPASELSQLTTDSRNFQSFKKRVMSLPAAPRRQQQQ